MNAAPSNYGLISFVYKYCWAILGQSLSEVVQEVHKGFLEFVPEDIFDGLWLQSLLNADFNIVSGIENIHLKKVATHTLSKFQLMVGDDRRIHHGSIR